METINGRIKSLRLSMRLTQVQLADRCAVTQPTIANIERGRTTEIKGSLLLKLAQQLNTTTIYLIHGAKDENSHEDSMIQSELTAIFGKLSIEDKQVLVRTARGLLQTTSPGQSVVDPFPNAQRVRTS